MRMFALPLTIVGTILVPLLHAMPAQALNNKSWVSSTGGGSTCTRASPCGNLQTAHDQTNAGGEIGVIDSADYGALVINRAISIIAEGVDATVISAGAGSAAIAISSSMAPTDVVTLQGLIIDGLGAGGIGISYAYGPAIVVKNCVIRNFKNPGGAGIFAQPNVAGKLTVTDTLLVNNGAGVTGAGIIIKPQTGGSVQALLERVTVVNNSHGIVADGNGSSISVRGVVRDSAASNNVNNGITTTSSGGGSAVLSVQNTNVSGNNFGLVSGGASSGMLVGQSSIVLNNTGLFTTGGGLLLSYKNNTVNGNTTDGAFTGLIGQQ